MKKYFLILMISFVGFSKANAQDFTHVEPWEEEFFFVDEEILDSGGIFTFWGLYFALGGYELIDTNNAWSHEITAELME